MPGPTGTRAPTRSATWREAVGGLDLPNMEALGLGNVEPLEGCPPQPGAPAVAGRLIERSKGKDTTTGHWEMMGIVTAQAFPTYPHGFPHDVIDPFMHETGPRRDRQQAGVGDGDHPGARRRAPGHGQVDRLHLGRLRLPDRRARGDRAARRAVRRVPDGARDPHRQARGRPRHRAAVRRRAGQLHAHAEPPRLLARAAAAELPDARCATPASRCTASARSATSSPTRTSTSRIRRSRTSRASSVTEQLLQELDDGFVFVNLVETDMLWGHRNDPRELPPLPPGLRPAAAGPARRAAPRRPAHPHLRPRLRPDDAVDRPLARARDAARVRRRAQRRRARATTASSPTSARP